MYRLLVSGSRDYSSPAILGMALLTEWMEHPDLVILHGAARGADQMAYEWALDHIGEERIEVYLAEWNIYGNAAGMIRNKKMIDTSPDKALFFFEPGAGNRGTQGCLKMAQEAGIPYEIYGKVL